jgi:hypothetical protein
MRKFLMVAVFLVANLIFNGDNSIANGAASIHNTSPSPLAPVGQSGDWILLFNDDFDGNP